MFRWETSGNAFNAWGNKVSEILATDSDGFCACITAVNTEINKLGAAGRIWNGSAAQNYYNESISPAVTAFKGSVENLKGVVEETCADLVKVINEVEIHNGGSAGNAKAPSVDLVVTITQPSFNTAEMDYNDGEMRQIGTTIDTTIVGRITAAQNNLINQFNKLGIYDECGLENTTTNTIDEIKSNFSEGVSKAVSAIIENMTAIGSSIKAAADNSIW